MYLYIFINNQFFITNDEDTEVAEEDEHNKLINGHDILKKKIIIRYQRKNIIMLPPLTTWIYME
uniref:Uncharacterized protein n=1 Tax=Mimivirus LCMiAC02 TaxID=2506609 RepID=A0A481Z0Q7_9VIRU|nr:MAG: hypothetical protein LCMiAC02_01860 [Mimivirus LCMiAC02]